MKTFYFTITLLWLCSYAGAQERVLTFGSQHFNEKTLPIYQEKLEQKGARFLAYDKRHGLVFVQVKAGKEQSVTDAMLRNELGYPLYVKQITIEDLDDLGIQDPIVREAFRKEITDKEKAIPEKEKVDAEKDKKKIQGKKLPIEYEKTGNPVVDEQNYQIAKEKWIQENPEEYQRYQENFRNENLNK